MSYTVVRRDFLKYALASAVLIPFDTGELSVIRKAREVWYGLNTEITLDAQLVF